MEKKLKKLSLKKETITSLSGNEQRHIYGGTNQETKPYISGEPDTTCPEGPAPSSVSCGGTCGGTCEGSCGGTCEDSCGGTCGTTNGATCGFTCGMTNGNTCGNCETIGDSYVECYTVNACYSMPPHCTAGICSACC